MTRTEEQPGDRGLIRCAVCDTLWKVPPTTLTATTTRDQDLPGNWYDLDLGAIPRMRMISDTPCPLCGGKEIDTMRCEIGPKMTRLLLDLAGLA